MDKETKRIVKQAIKRGWKFNSGRVHHILIHPSGRKVAFSVSPSCPHAYKNFERDVNRVERGQRKKYEQASVA